jgi:hypothetical protein
MSTDMNTQIGEKIKPLRSNREVFEPAPTSNKTTLRILEIKGDPSDIGQIKIRMLDQFGKELLVSSRFPANAASKTSIDSQSRIKNLPSSPKGSSILAHHKSISDLMNTTPMQQKTKVLWIANFGNEKSRICEIFLSETSFKSAATLVIEDTNLTRSHTYLSRLELSIGQTVLILDESRHLLLPSGEIRGEDNNIRIDVKRLVGSCQEKPNGVENRKAWLEYPQGRCEALSKLYFDVGFRPKCRTACPCTIRAARL